jgi:pimeloyl-ACP methyl ester carboxylesterase
MSDGGTVSHQDRSGRAAATAYRVAGNGPCVVLIHGVGMQASIWQQQIDVLAKRHRVVAYDMLGHGGSSLPPKDCTLADYADQLLALFDELEIGRAAVIGHSMGALVALEFAVSHPDRVSAVAALNAVFRRSDLEKAAVGQRAAQLDDATAVTFAGPAIARWFGDPVPAALSGVADQARRLLDAVDPEGYRRSYRLFATADAAHKDRLATLSVPALFLTGTDDPNSTPAMSQAMADLVPNGRAEILPGQRHMVSLTDPDAVNRLLLDFLNAAFAPAVERIPFRRALGSFLTGVTIVSTLQPDGAPRGFTANSFTSVSLDPPLVSVCIARTAASFDLFAAAEYFSVNVLADHQAALSGLFASKSPEKFTQTPWRAGISGSPIIEGVTAWFDCRRHEVVDAGDHIILIGRVLDFADSQKTPLGYCRGAHVTFNLPLNVFSGNVSLLRVGAILEQARAILFVEEADGAIALPHADRSGGATQPGSLITHLDGLGLKAELNFLFSVFEDEHGGARCVSIYYRGKIAGAPNSESEIRLIKFDAVPWERIKSQAVAVMLRRYIEERNSDIFGVYVGDRSEGSIHPLG